LQKTCMAALAAAVLLLAGCASPDRVTAASSLESEKGRKNAPDFALKDSNGKIVKLSDYKGKVVLLNFWATWCGPCKIEIPWFIDFEQRYKDRGFAVIGVTLDEESWDSVKPYITEKKVNYRVVMGDDSVSHAYDGVDSLPTTFIIDQQGRIASKHIGLVSKSDYEHEIVKLLSGSAGAARTD
jgi:peroxiredoxin